MTPNAEATLRRIDAIKDSLEAEKATKQTGIRNRNIGDSRRLDVVAYLAAHNRPLNGTKTLDNGSIMYFIDCPKDYNHDGKQAGITQYTSGAIAFECKHEGCSDFHWNEARQAISADARLDPWMIEGNGQPSLAFLNNSRPLREDEAERLAIQAEESAGYQPEPTDYGMKIINAADWLKTEPPPPDQVLEDVVDAGDKLVIIASSKMRKSFFAGQLGIALAAHPKFLGWRIPKKRRVIYVQFEIRAHHCWRRIRNLAQAMGVGPHDIEDRLMILPGRGLDLRGAEGLEKIRQAAADFHPEVIILDPLYKLAAGVENAAEDFKILLNAFDQLAEQTGAAIFYIHHDTTGSPGDKDIRDRGAGSNVLGRDYDACVTLTPHATEPDATVVEVLLRNYKPQEPFTIVWGCVDGGYCFNTADDVLPSKKTSRTKQAAPVVSSYLPIAEAILVGGDILEIGRFKVLLKEKTRISNARINDFITWATSGRRPPMQTKEERGRGVHRKWISMTEASCT